MIRSFQDARTAALFKGSAVRSVAPDLAKRAQRQLQRLHDTVSLVDLAGFPGSRLKRMQGNAERVEFCDYH